VRWIQLARVAGSRRDVKTLGEGTVLDEETAIDRSLNDAG
jgi:hypothetical protein